MTGAACQLCEPWPAPPDCCDDVCVTEEHQALFDMWWEAVVPWAWEETCCQFGICDVEVAPCAPCGCPTVCKCGPWQTLDLSQAFGACPIVVEGEVPQIEFRFPDGEGGTVVYDHTTVNGFSIRPDMHTVDWCCPIFDCVGWPSQDCREPWTIAAKVGRKPPDLLIKSLGMFVCEIVKDCLGQESCLPDGVTSITRRGTSFDIDKPSLDSTTIRFDEKNTGIPLLDMAFRRWGDCGIPFAMVDMLGDLDGKYRRSWTFRPLWPAVPVPLAV